MLNFHTRYDRCPLAHFVPLCLELRLESPDGGLEDCLLVRQLLHSEQSLRQLVSHLKHFRLDMRFNLRVSSGRHCRGQGDGEKWRGGGGEATGSKLSAYNTTKYNMVVAMGVQSERMFSLLSASVETKTAGEKKKSKKRPMLLTTKRCSLLHTVYTCQRLQPGGGATMVPSYPYKRCVHQTRPDANLHPPTHSPTHPRPTYLLSSSATAMSCCTGRPTPCGDAPPSPPPNPSPTTPPLPPRCEGEDASVAPTTPATAAAAAAPAAVPAPEPAPNRTPGTGARRPGSSESLFRVENPWWGDDSPPFEARIWFPALAPRPDAKRYIAIAGAQYIK